MFFTTKIMEKTLEKLKLPCDIIYYILQFCRNKQGYTDKEVQYINVCKNKNALQQSRIKVELYTFRDYNFSISFLRGYPGSYSGFFKDRNEEAKYAYIAYEKRYIDYRTYYYILSDILGFDNQSILI